MPIRPPSRGSWLRTWASMVGSLVSLAKLRTRKLARASLATTIALFSLISTRATSWRRTEPSAPLSSTAPPAIEPGGAGASAHLMFGSPRLPARTRIIGPDRSIARRAGTMSGKALREVGPSDRVHALPPHVLRIAHLDARPQPGGAAARYRFGA